MDKSKKNKALGHDPLHDLGDLTSILNPLTQVNKDRTSENNKLVKLVERPASEAASSNEINATKPKKATGFQLLLWGSAFIIMVGLVYFFWQKSSVQSSSPVSISIPVAQSTPLATVIFPSPSPSATLTPVTTVVNKLQMPTPPPGGVVGVVLPAREGVGWATSLDGRSHFGFPNIHAGYLDGHIYYGALHFDLADIPPGSTITYAALELVGTDTQNLRAGGTWQIQLLDSAINMTWPELTYQMLDQALIDSSIPVTLPSTDLGPGRVNVISFAPAQLTILEQHLANGVVSFRLDGPTSGADNLFTWDTGYRTEETLETRPKLRLVVLPPARPDQVIVTSTPTPENIITVAAEAVIATEIANKVGTYTPVPENWVTPIVIIPSPPPANKATANHLADVATAEAFLFGTPAATPANIWTATPIATDTPQPDNTQSTTPTDTPFHPPPTKPTNHTIVTSVPTPENVITVVAMAVQATQVARSVGTYTPVPSHWVTPIIVTPQPTPGNAATASYQADLTTAEAFLYGPAIPTPLNVWTATPIPIFIPLDGDVATPWATLTPSPTPQPVPDALVGKIAFLSTRSGGPQPLANPLVYLMDPDGSKLALLTDPSLYQTLATREQYSADQRFRALVKDALRFDGKQIPAIYFYDSFYNAEEQVTHFGAGLAWDPVWSPTAEQIAFVSNDSQDDEIWVVDRNGHDLTRLTQTNEPFNAQEIGKDSFIPEVNGQPSWSPDGSQIVFWSNRTGRRQIWVMHADGSNPHQLNPTPYDDWNPIWIKYSDPVSP